MPVPSTLRRCILCLSSLLRSTYPETPKDSRNRIRLQEMNGILALRTNLGATSWCIKNQTRPNSLTTSPERMPSSPWLNCFQRRPISLHLHLPVWPVQRPTEDATRRASTNCSAQKPTQETIHRTRARKPSRSAMLCQSSPGVESGDQDGRRGGGKKDSRWTS